MGWPSVVPLGLLTPGEALAESCACPCGCALSCPRLRLAQHLGAVDPPVPSLPIDTLHHARQDGRIIEASGSVD